MHVFTDLNEWLLYRQNLSTEKKIGFIPTMGNLHKGHGSLMVRSQADNDVTIASIFVNPTQFNQKADFDSYPRTLDADLAFLKQLGVSACFVPNATAMYPKNSTYTIQETIEDKRLEGLSRPGHFTGMLTIVMKLLQIIRPTSLYLGEKDYQQCLLIEGMVRSFFLPVSVIVCPTIREDSGLPYSSRNNRLSAEERQTADHFVQLFHQGKDCTAIKQTLENAGIQVDYIADADNHRFAAVFIGSVRLIDHYPLD